MRVRSLKQALHWLFLVVGIVSVLLLAFSVMTYLDYAREGYGLDISIADARLIDGDLVLRLSVENPGGLDIYLGGVDGSLTVGESYTVSFDPVLIKAGNVTTLIVSTEMAPADLSDLSGTGRADLLLNLNVTVPERDVRTNYRLEALDVEVKA